MEESDFEDGGEGSVPFSADGVASGCRKFPSQVTATLESLYSHGMTGWGKNHEEDIKAAIEGTGLSLTQIKVGCY